MTIDQHNGYGLHACFGNAPLNCDRSFIGSLNERPDNSAETIVGRLLRPANSPRKGALLVFAGCAFEMLETPRQDLLQWWRAMSWRWRRAG
jgi:hypothetical protein